MLDTIEVAADPQVATSEVRGDRALVRLSGDLDAHTAPAVHELLDTLAKRGARHFMIDASGLSFVDSSGIRIVGRLLADHPTSIVTLVGASPLYRKLLDLAGLTAHLALLE